MIAKQYHYICSACKQVSVFPVKLKRKSRAHHCFLKNTTAKYKQVSFGQAMRRLVKNAR